MKKAIKIDDVTTIGVPSKWIRLATPEFTTCGYDKLPDAEHFLDGWKEVVTPHFDKVREKLGELVEYPTKFEYDVDTLSEAQIEDNLINQSEANRQAIIDETIRQENEASVDATYQAIEDPEELLNNIDAFPLWTIGETYLLNKKIKHVVSGEMKLFKVNQPSLTADETYQPGAEGTDALYTEIAPPGVIPAWEQPSGAQDAYDLDYVVAHNGEQWQSRRAANTYEPGTASSGWLQISNTPAPWYNLGNEGYPNNWEVTHNSKFWRNGTAGNTWEPGVFGWTEYIP